MPDSIGDEVERWARELRKGSTRLALLVALAKGESYGYELLTRLRDQSDLSKHTTEATVYPILHDLEKRRFLIARWKSTNPGVPPRKYYRLTPQGTQFMVAMVDAWDDYRTQMDLLVAGELDAT